MGCIFFNFWPTASGIEPKSAEDRWTKVGLLQSASASQAGSENLIHKTFQKAYQHDG